MTEALPLWRSLGLQSDEAMALRTLAWIAYETGDLDTCARRAEEALAIFRAVGHPSGTAGALGLVARLARDRGDTPTAVVAYQADSGCGCRPTSAGLQLEGSVEAVSPRSSPAGRASTIVASCCRR